MYRSLLVLLFTLLCISAFSQKKAFHSAYPFGSGIGLDDEVQDAFYQGKYIYTTGNFAGSVDFDPSQDITLFYTGYTAGEREDIYFAKYDTLDNLVWAKHLKGNAVNKALSITADKDGNVLVCGEFIGEIDLDPGSSQYVVSSHFQERNSFVAKYDEDGHFLWGFVLDGGRANAALDIATDFNKNCIITGYFRDTMDIDPSSGKKLLKAAYSKEIFLVQYDSTGKLKWGYSMGSATDDEGTALYVDSRGQIYLSGMFSRTVDFDPSTATTNLTSQGGLDVFMAKYTNKGAFTWAKRIGGSRDNILAGMACRNDKIWICGDFERQCDFDPSSNTYFPPLRGNRDLYVGCYDTTGSFNWAHSFGSNGAYTYGHGVAADSNGNCYIVAFSDYYVDWDPSKQTHNLKGRDDVILASYNDKGAFRWAHKLGGTKVDKPSAVIDAGSSVACYGYFDTKAEFGTLGTSAELVAGGVTSEYNSGFHARYTKPKGKILGAFSNTDDLGGGDVVLATTHDLKGNIYVGGYVSGMVDVDHSDSSTKYLNGEGIGKVLLARYDSNMVLDYAFDFFSTGNAQISDMVVDDSLHLYFTGTFEDTLYLNSKRRGNRLVAQAVNDGIFGKVDPKGKLLWAKRIAGSSRVYGHSIDLDSKGNVIIAGGFAGKADFDPSTNNEVKTSLGSYDAYVAKYSNSGAYQWVVNFGNTDFDFCRDAKVGANDDVYITGAFEYSCNFNPNGVNVRRTSAGETDIFIGKYNSQGIVQWVKTFGNSLTDIPSGLELDRNENVYNTGYFSGKVDFDPSGKTRNFTSLGKDDVYLLSLDSLGQYRWAHQYGSKNNTGSESGEVIEYHNGRIFLGGTFSDTTDFDPSSNSYWLYTPNAFVTVLDTSGNFEEAHSFGSKKQPEHISDFTFSGNSLYVCGSYQDDTDFDPSTTSQHLLTNKRSNDGFLLRLTIPTSCHHSSNTLNISQCGPYTLPSGERTVSVDGTYSDIIRNKEGCDSNITIVYKRLDHLTSNTVMSCGPYQSPAGNTYTQSGTYYDTLSNQFSCDSVIITHLQIGSTYSSRKAESCDSFYLPGNQKWVAQSGVYVDSFTNQLSCDSLVEVDVTINHSFYQETPVSACDQFTIPSSQQVVQQSGVYVDSFQTPAGCDSVLTWKVDIHPSSHQTVQKTICDSFYLTGGQVWIHQTGTYHDSFVSIHGCDSTVTWEIEKTDLHAGFQMFGDSLVADSSGYEQYQWFSCNANDTTPIQGADTSYYVVMQTGTYALGVKEGDCSEFSTCQQVIIVSGSGNTRPNIKLFPNPTTGFVTVQMLNSTTKFTGWLYSASGKKLMEFGTLNSGTHSLDLSALPPGPYILSLQREDGEMFRELVVKE